MAMCFYMTPGLCSTGIHILPAELELPFEVGIVNLPTGEHRKPEYRAINPKSTIPTLVRQNGSALTEFQAIAWWLARTHPKRNFCRSSPTTRHTLWRSWIMSPAISPSPSPIIPTRAGIPRCQPSAFSSIIA